MRSLGEPWRPIGFDIEPDRYTRGDVRLLHGAELAGSGFATMTQLLRGMQAASGLKQKKMPVPNCI